MEVSNSFFGGGYLPRIPNTGENLLDELNPALSEEAGEVKSLAPATASSSYDQFKEPLEDSIRRGDWQETFRLYCSPKMLDNSLDSFHEIIGVIEGSKRCMIAFAIFQDFYNMGYATEYKWWGKKETVHIPPLLSLLQLPPSWLTMDTLPAVFDLLQNVCTLTLGTSACNNKYIADGSPLPLTSSFYQANQQSINHFLSRVWLYQFDQAKKFNLLHERVSFREFLTLPPIKNEIQSDVGFIDFLHHTFKLIDRGAIGRSYTDSISDILRYVDIMLCEREIDPRSCNFLSTNSTGSDASVALYKLLNCQSYESKELQNFLHLIRYRYFVFNPAMKKMGKNPKHYHCLWDQGDRLTVGCPDMQYSISRYRLENPDATLDEIITYFSQSRVNLFTPLYESKLSAYHWLHQIPELNADTDYSLAEAFPVLFSAMLCDNQTKVNDGKISYQFTLGLYDFECELLADTILFDVLGAAADLRASFNGFEFLKKLVEKRIFFDSSPLPYNFSFKTQSNPERGPWSIRGEITLFELCTLIIGYYQNKKISEEYRKIFEESSFIRFTQVIKRSEYHLPKSSKYIRLVDQLLNTMGDHPNIPFNGTYLLLADNADLWPPCSNSTEKNAIAYLVVQVLKSKSISTKGKKEFLITLAGILPVESSLYYRYVLFQDTKLPNLTREDLFAILSNTARSSSLAEGQGNRLIKCALIVTHIYLKLLSDVPDQTIIGDYKSRDLILGSYGNRIQKFIGNDRIYFLAEQFLDFSSYDDSPRNYLSGRSRMQRSYPFSWAVRLAAKQSEISDRYQRIMMFLSDAKGGHQKAILDIIQSSESSRDKALLIQQLAERIHSTAEVPENVGTTGFFSKIVPAEMYIPFWFWVLHLFKEQLVDEEFISSCNTCDFSKDLGSWFMDFTPYSLAAKHRTLDVLFPEKRSQLPIELTYLLEEIKNEIRLKTINEKCDLDSLSLNEMYQGLEQKYKDVFAVYINDYTKPIVEYFNKKDFRLSLFESLKTYSGRWVIDCSQVPMGAVIKKWGEVWQGKYQEKIFKKGAFNPNVLFSIRNKIFKEMIRLFNLINYSTQWGESYVKFREMLNDVCLENKRNFENKGMVPCDATSDELLIQALLDVKLSSIKDCLLNSIRRESREQAPHCVEEDSQIGCILESFGEGRFRVHFSHLYFSEDNQLYRIGEGAGEISRWICEENEPITSNSVDLNYEGLVSLVNAFRKEEFQDRETEKRIILLTLSGVKSNGNPQEQSPDFKKRKHSQTNPSIGFTTNRIQDMVGNISSKNDTKIFGGRISHFNTFKFTNSNSEEASVIDDIWDMWTLQLFHRIIVKERRKGNYLGRELFGYGSELIEKVKKLQEVVESPQFRNLEFLLTHEHLNLRGYQRETVRKILAARMVGLKGYLAALDMGLGKTAIAVEVMLQKYVEKKGEDVKTVFICTASTLAQSANAMKKMISGLILKLLKDKYQSIQSIANANRREFQLKKVLFCASRNASAIEYVDDALSQSWKTFTNQVKEDNGWAGMDIVFNGKSASELKFSLPNESSTDKLMLDFDLANQVVICDNRQKLDKLPSSAFVFAKWGAITAAKGNTDVLSAISKQPWDIVIVDEAHEINNQETKHYQLIKAYQERVGAFCLLLSGTPLENEFLELVTLLSLIDDFQDACRRTYQLIADVGGHLQRHEMESALSPEPIVTAFANILGLRKVLGLVSTVLTMKSVVVNEDWEGKVPIVNKVSIQKPPTTQQSRLIEGIAESIDFTKMTKDNSYFSQIQKIKTILLHPSLSDEQNDEQGKSIERLEKLSPEETKEWMKESEKLVPFLPDEAIGTVIQQNEPVMIFVDRINAGKLLAILLKNLYKGITVDFLNGETSSEMRQKFISRFNNACDASENPHILICSIGAGNAGIDCPKGKHLVLFDRNFNPMVEKQAYSRIVRIGNNTIKNIYKLDCGTAFEVRMAALAKKKKLLSKTFLREELDLSKFLKYLLHEIEFPEEMHAALTDSILCACEEEEIQRAVEMADPILNFNRKKAKESSESVADRISSEEDVSRQERLSGKEEIDDNETEEKRKNPFTEASLQKRARVSTQPVVDQKPSSNSVKLNLAYWQGEAQSLSINGEQFDLLPIRADNSFSRSICAGICLSKNQPAQLPKSYEKSDFLHAHISLTTLAKANQPLVDVLSGLQNDWAKLNPKRAEIYCLERKIKIDIFNINGEIKEARGDQSGEESLKLLELVNPSTNETHYDLLIKSG